MEFRREPYERKPSAYKNINSSSIQIINENDLKITQEVKVEQSQSNTNGIYELLYKIRQSIISSS